MNSTKRHDLMAANDNEKPIMASHFTDLAARRTWLATWAAGAPKTDSGILPPAPRNISKKTLAYRFAGLLAYREICEERRADSTNFLAPDMAATDADDSVSASIDMTDEIRPSCNEILKEIALAFRPFVRTRRGKVVAKNKGGVDYGDDRHINPRSRKLIRSVPTRIGRLRFSNGAQVERCKIRNDVGEIEAGFVRVPRGGLLDSTYRYSDERGEENASGNLPATTARRHRIHSSNQEDVLIENDERARILRQLSPADIATLDAALEARNFGDIGKAFGHRGDYARKAGRRLLEAANDNFLNAANKVAA